MYRLINKYLIILVIIQIQQNTVLSAGLSFNKEPESDLLENGAVTFSCEPSPAFAMVEWLREDKPLNLSEQSKYVINHFQRGLVYSITVREKTTAIYNCVISIPGLRLVSRPAEAIANTIGKFPQGEDRHIEVGKSSIAVVPCGPLPHSIPPPVPIISRNGKTVVAGNRFELLPSGNLYIDNAVPEDSGQYVCSAENPFTKERVVAPFKVNLIVSEPRMRREPQIIHKPMERVEAVLGTNVTFECLADGFPKPVITWRRVGSYLPIDHSLEDGLLKLINVAAKSAGTYECSASSNGENPAIAQTNLVVQEPPQIEPPKTETVEIEEGNPITLECSVIKGEPKPLVKWLHNGDYIKTNEENHLFVTDSELHISKSNKTLHAGHYQCFASNSLDTTYIKYLVRIPTMRENSRRPVIQDEGRSTRRPSRKHRLQKERLRHPQPPKPEVSQLTDTSVLVSWNMDGANDTLNFFKVQYHAKGEDWKTWDADLSPKETSVEISGLSSKKWKFRLVAVYQDNSHQQGKSSDWFNLNPMILTPPPEGTITPPVEGVPIIEKVTSSSPTTIIVHWFMPTQENIDGFLVECRRTDSAGEFDRYKVTNRPPWIHAIDHLLPDTYYEIRVAAFNGVGIGNYSHVNITKTQAEIPLNPIISENDINIDHPFLSEHRMALYKEHMLLFTTIGGTLSIACVLLLACIVYYAKKFTVTKNPKLDPERLRQREAAAYINGDCNSNFTPSISTVDLGSQGQNPNDITSTGESDEDTCSSRESVAHEEVPRAEKEYALKILTQLYTTNGHIVNIDHFNTSTSTTTTATTTTTTQLQAL